MNLSDEKTIFGNRVYDCVASVREYLIFCGGYAFSPGSAYNDLWTYNTITGAWKRYQPPIELEYICRYPKICAAGNQVYIIGFHYPEDGDPKINSIVSFEVPTAKWKTFCFKPSVDSDDDSYNDDENGSDGENDSEGENDSDDDNGIDDNDNGDENDHADNADNVHDNDQTNAPPPMNVNLLFYYNGFLYVMGDSEETSELNIMYKFCLKISKWSLVRQIGDTPIFHGDVYGSVFHNQVYVFESRYKPTNRFRKVRIFDLLTNSWTKRATKSKNQDYPHDRAHESYTFSDKYAYMSGGCTEDEKTDYKDIWRIDLETLEWMKLDYCHKRGIHGHIMCVVQNSILFSVGGCIDNRPCLDAPESFTIGLSSLYHLALASVCRSPNWAMYLASLPMTIVDELNFNNNDSSSDD